MEKTVKTLKENFTINELVVVRKDLERIFGPERLSEAPDDILKLTVDEIGTEIRYGNGDYYSVIVLYVN